MLLVLLTTLLKKAGPSDDDMVLKNVLSVFTRKIGTNEYDDIMPRGPKGIAAILAQYNDVVAFTENGVQIYNVKNVEFDSKPENENKTEGEPKYYHFQPGARWEPYKSEIFTYRGDIVNSTIPYYDFVQLFHTICYGLKWETWQDQQEVLMAAIERETRGSRFSPYANIRKILYEWADGMNGKFQLDMYDYRKKEEKDDDDDEDD